MYFLAHAFVLLKAIQNRNFEENKLLPLLYGCWAPDAGYFPFFSWQLTHFKHSKKPLIHLFNEPENQKLFQAGWNIHLKSDKIIHNKPFFRNKPLCPEIRKNEGLKIFLESSRQHLGREICLDLFIYEYLLNQDKKITKILFQKQIYSFQTEVSVKGFRLFQKYIYNYINRIIPFLISTKILPMKIKNFIDCPFFRTNLHKAKLEELLQHAIKKSIEILEKENNY